MVENGKAPEFRYEYEHYVLFPGVHFGKHAQWGDHIALGDGENSLHIYPSKIWIGGKNGTEVALTPSQMFIIKRILNRFEQKVTSDKLLEKVQKQEKAPCPYQTSASPQEQTRTPEQSAAQAQSAEASPPPEQLPPVVPSPSQAQ